MHDPYNLVSKILLDSDTCNKIIENNLAGLQRIVQSTYRSVDIKEINIDDIPNLKQSIISANNAIYQLELNGFIECYFSKYSTNDHYDKLHLDAGPGEITRKLSFSLLLNDDYTGGDFYMLDQCIEKKKGKLIVFPSFLPHRVSNVLSGTRYAIFGFLSGPRLK
jgi:predicted 2-oxoglutarate/Fe(II)-dependent dioxygenase YbiX